MCQLLGVTTPGQDADLAQLLASMPELQALLHKERARAEAERARAEAERATSTQRIAALEKERDELVIVKKIGGSELALLRELYRRQIEQARLQANFDLATRVHGDLALRHEQSRTQPLGSTAQLQVIDEALPADRPVSRRRLQFATFGAAGGFFLAVVLAAFWEARGRRA